jgi:transcriptional regulator with XRE-family HTH domain
MHPRHYPEPTGAALPMYRRLAAAGFSSRGHMRSKENVSVDKHVGQRLRDRRNEMELSQTAVGGALGVTFQQIQKYETGFNRISSSRLHQLAAILGVDVPYFFDGGPGKRVLKSSGPDSDYIGKFTASAEGKRLMQAFLRIEDRELRRHITQLVTMLAD